MAVAGQCAASASLSSREGSVACRGEIGDNCGKQAGEKGENRVQCGDGNNGDAGDDKTVFQGRRPRLASDEAFDQTRHPDRLSTFA